MSYLHVNKPEIDFYEGELETDYDEKVYQKGRENLLKFIENKWLIKEKEKIFYVYMQQFEDQQQFGIMLEASVDDYAKNIIKRHEITRAEKEEDRTKLTDIQGANAGPVFLAYEAVDKIDEIVEQIVKQKPFFEVFDKTVQEQHTLWKCTVEQSLELQKLFKSNVKAFYIADGHHRSASAYNVGKMHRQRAIAAGKQVTGDEDFNYFMALAYPTTKLKIVAYNRVIKDLGDKSVEEILQQIGKSYEIQELLVTEDPQPQKKGEVGMHLDGKWFKLTIKAECVDVNHPINSLDVQLLTTNIITPIFGIKDIKNDKRIDFISGKRGLVEIVKRCQDDCKIGFAMYPLQVEEVFRVADAGLILPPKSTWFEPKPKSGCIVRVFED